MTELLDLATVVERDTVRIRTKKNPEGKLYELLDLEELGAYERELLLTRHTKWSAAERTDRKMSVTERRDAHRALGDILKMIVRDLEPSVLAEMEMLQRARIVGAWAQKNGSDGAAEGEAPGSPPTTAGSSRASRRSTAGSRKRGSTSRAGS